MALTLKERADSPMFDIGASGGSCTRKWFAKGSEDEVTVYVATLAEAGSYYQGFIRNNISITRLGGPNWDVEVGYGSTGAGGSDQPTGANGLGGTPAPLPTAPDDTTPLGTGYSFDTSGREVHITKSIQTLYRRKAIDNGALDPDFVGTGPDNQSAIGITEGGDVLGCDIITPKLEWSRDVFRATVTPKYMQQIRDLVGTLNASVFYGFPVASVLYLGASGQFTQGEGWSITHKFAVGENKFNVDCGNGITVPEKLAWEYLWVAYESGPVGGVTLPIPQAAYVEGVYDRQHFNGILFGGVRFGGLEIGE